MQNPYLDFVKRYHAAPVAFVEEVLGVTPDPWQRDLLRLLAAGERKVSVRSGHGTGKSTHIEQVAARLNWPCIRVNLDSHISRIDLIGKDAIVLKDGKQVTEFREGILPWALQHACALVW